MFKIKKIHAREILNSRGLPTIAVEIKLDNNRRAWASVPSGASTGSNEALELKDGDKKRYAGQGVLKAIRNVNRIIAPKLIGRDPYDQEEIDNLMIKLDGTKNKSRLGANAILGVSLALARIAAISQGKILYDYLRKKFFYDEKEWRFPFPMMNIINGGVHADFSLDFQEYLIIPQQKKAKDRIRCGTEIFQKLGVILKNKGYFINYGAEGGYAPKLVNNEQPLKIIFETIKKAGYNNHQVKLGIDVAASQIYNSKKRKYLLKSDKKELSTNEMIEMFQSLIKKYPIISLEDGLAEDDWQGWQQLTKVLGNKILLVGDDLFVTNIKRLARGIEEKTANAIIIKPNQIGTLTETINCLKMAKKNNFKVIISHRSGETNDDFITDLAVAANADYLKAGSVSRGERVAKYNRLLTIEEEVE